MDRTHYLTSFDILIGDQDIDVYSKYFKMNKIYVYGEGIYIFPKFIWNLDFQLLKPGHFLTNYSTGEKV